MEGSLSSSSKGTVVNRTEIELVSCGGCNWKLKLLRRRRRSFTGVAVGDVNGALERGAEKDTDDALASVLGDTVVVVDYAQQHQRVNHHLLYRSPRYLLRLYHIHRCLFSYSYSNFTDSFSPEPYFLLFLLYQSINQSTNQSFFVFFSLLLPISPKTLSPSQVSTETQTASISVLGYSDGPNYRLRSKPKLHWANHKKEIKFFEGANIFFL